MKGLVSKIAIVAVVTLVLTTGSAMAAQLEGIIALNGKAELRTYADAITQVTEFHNADRVVFIRESTNVEDATKNFGSVLLDYYGTPQVAIGTFRDASGVPCTTADLLIYEIGSSAGFKFEVLTIDSYAVLDPATDMQFLTLTGTAVAKHAAYDDTYGVWTYSMSRTAADQTVFTWEGSFATTPTPPVIPEPTTMLLLGTGLLGIATLARRNRNK